MKQAPSGLKILRLDAGCQFRSPSRLASHRLTISLGAARREKNEFGSFVVRVRSEHHHPVLLHLVRQPLYRLARKPHIASKMRDGQPHGGKRDRSHHLPAGARQRDIRHKRVACIQQSAIQAKNLQNEFTYRVRRRGRGMIGLVHMTS